MWRLYQIGNIIKQRLNKAMRNNDGIGVVEVILILVVLIALVLIFKNQLISLVETIFNKITSESSGI
ncbi:MAG: Flp1 family type IVb pilin [Suipraeoptans sp.]